MVLTSGWCVWDNLNTEALPRTQVEMVITAMNNLVNGTGRRGW